MARIYETYLPRQSSPLNQIRIFYYRRLKSMKSLAPDHQQSEPSH